MIFTDSGAVYAIFDKKDINHHSASDYFENNIKENSFIITTPVLIECWYLIDSRLGNFYSQKFLDSVHSNIFNLKEINYIDFLSALNINQMYKDIEFGLVDLFSFAFIDRNKISTIFTFDKKYFNIYKPQNLKYLNLVP
ncbi:MAG: PIN domain-containing protein [Actinobacteria bacterium]|nr:PIN domain-containing protein [Actinomycetota bacterium]